MLRALTSRKRLPHQMKILYDGRVFQMQKAAGPVVKASYWELLDQLG